MWTGLLIVGTLGVAVFAAWQRARYRDLQLLVEEERRDREAQVDAHAAALAAERAQREAVFHSMIEGVLILDGQGRVQLVNRALEHFFNLNRDVRGLTVMEAFRSHRLQELVERIAREGEVRGADFAPPGPAELALQTTGALLSNPDGRRHGMILVFHDQTRLLQLENNRRDFVANVSHELRTPLSMIKGYVETLRDGARNDPTVADSFLAKIEKHTDRLALLIEDLLTISSLESGQVVIQVEDIDLGTVITRVCDDLEARARSRDVRLANEIPVGLRARGDARRLAQVLFNLVENAIKYGRPSGHVHIAARTLDPDRIEVSVTDDGPGIPEESLGRVFERFYRVDKGRSREQGGTGLGLAIVKHIVQAHGGEVRAVNRPGGGAEFSFTLAAA